MAQTKAGAKKAVFSIKQKHGEDFYSLIGSKGGRASSTGGFAAKIPCDCNVISDSHFKRQCAGKKGGTKSRKTAK